MGVHTLYQASRSRILVMLAIIAVAATALLAVTAQAAPKMPTATISIADSSVARSVAADGATDGVFYGASVAFDHTLEAKMGKNNYVTINVVCKQDGVTVYNWYGQPDFSFPIRAQGGNVYTWLDGTAADCDAHLRYYANHRVSVVATTSFGVVGS